MCSPFVFILVIIISGLVFTRCADGRGWAVIHRLVDNTALASIQPTIATPATSEEVCVVCMEGARAVGLVHGETVHVVVCRSCSDVLMQKPGAQCPLCRSQIDRVVTVY
jgi:hypothetical protein